MNIENIKWLLVGIQLLLLTVQIGCTIYSKRQNVRPSDVLGGFGIWGAVPNISLMIIILNI